MNTLESKFWTLVVTAFVVVVIFNIVLASVQPYAPLIGISVSIIVVLATALIAWRIVSVKTRRFW